MSAATPELHLRFTKYADGDAVLRAERADRSITWQRQRGAQGAFLPPHDLTHYAVERELGAARGFYGLLAVGWEIADTTGKGARGHLPPEAILVEHLVCLLTLERAGAADWTGATLGAALDDLAHRAALPAPRPIEDAELARVRATMRELHARWAALPPGEALDLVFVGAGRSLVSEEEA